MTEQRKMIPTTFEEHGAYDYKGRTYANAKRADATIAIAVYFGTAGEVCTKNAVESARRPYMKIDVSKGLVVIPKDVVLITNVLDTIIYHPDEGLTLNIAGNGLYTMANKYTQAQCDEYVYQLLNAVMTKAGFTQKIGFIITGGQSGFDQAGIKAGQRVYLPTHIIAPKGWKFRDRTGTDISNEKLFKQRFDIVVPVEGHTNF